MSKGQEVNRSDLAKFFGVSLPTVDNWIKNGLPYVKKPDGRLYKQWSFDTSSVHEWLLERAKEAIKPEEPLDFERARTRKVHLEAELAEIELKLKQGELVRADLVQKIGIDFILACKTKLLALPKKLSPQLSPKDPKRAESLLEKGICDALNELQQYEYFTDFDQLTAVEGYSSELD